MDPKYHLISFILGAFLPSVIHSHRYLPLYVDKLTENAYGLHDTVKYSRESKSYEFALSDDFQMFYACPEENAPKFITHALAIQDEVISNVLAHHTCPQPIRPIVMKVKPKYVDKFTPSGADNYHIGYVIHDKTKNFEVSKLFEDFEDENVAKEYDFITMLEVKFDKSKSVVISVEYMILKGRVLDPDPKIEPPVQFKPNVEIYEYDVNSLYSDANQQRVFAELFGLSYSLYLEYPTRALSKMPLAPEDDFLMVMWKIPTFMDLNSAPMWTQLRPQWRKVEVFVRRILKKLVGLLVETGTAKVLQLRDTRGNLNSIYLHQDERLPVPGLFWKLVRFGETNETKYYIQSILIVMHNDPYTENQQPLCDDIAEANGWLISNPDYKTGLTYACPVTEEIMTKLYDEFKMTNEVLNLSPVKKLNYDDKHQVIETVIDARPPEIPSRL